MDSASCLRVDDVQASIQKLAEGIPLAEQASFCDFAQSFFWQPSLWQMAPCDKAQQAMLAECVTFLWDVYKKNSLNAPFIKVHKVPYEGQTCLWSFVVLRVNLHGAALVLFEKQLRLYMPNLRFFWQMSYHASRNAAGKMQRLQPADKNANNNETLFCVVIDQALAVDAAMLLEKNLAECVRVFTVQSPETAYTTFLETHYAFVRARPFAGAKNLHQKQQEYLQRQDFQHQHSQDWRFSHIEDGLMQGHVLHHLAWSMHENMQDKSEGCANAEEVMQCCGFFPQIPFPCAHDPFFTSITTRLWRLCQSQHIYLAHSVVEKILLSFPLPVLWVLTDTQLLHALTLFLARGNQLDVKAFPAGAEGAFYLFTGAQHQLKAALPSLKKSLSDAPHGSSENQIVDLSPAVPFAPLFLWSTACNDEEHFRACLQAFQAHHVLSWDEHFRDCLAQKRHEQTPHDDTFTYTALRPVLPAAYRLSVTPRQAAQDMQALYNLQANTFKVIVDDTDLASTEQNASIYLLKLYRHDYNLPLSTLIPVLTHIGIEVVSEKAFNIPLKGHQDAWVHLMNVRLVKEWPDSLKQLTALLQDALNAIYHQDETCDPLSSLLVLQGLGWRAIRVLRAYGAYLKQLNVIFNVKDFYRFLTTHHAITNQLFQLFDKRFSPVCTSYRSEEQKKDIAVLKKNVNALEAQDAKEVFHKCLELIVATVRTTYYRLENNAPKDYISFKIDVTKLSGLPQPQPLYEIFVYSVFMEGVHLRSGLIARGGLRASERPDYRGEVLDLMRTQVLKNAAIVPAGAKGGFICKKHHHRSGKDFPDSYETFVKGLLDITDNHQQDMLIKPPFVRCYDADDNYLVVAADKGTATRSDDANALAHRYQFWLGDAFASGGSQGYDHKKMGITARSAWVSVQHHFEQLGCDQKKTITAVGVGDMSGDVFGNGMLLSKKIKLLGAFDHRHIFIDPCPVPGVSFKERQRLFKLPRSSWKDYQKLSDGGMVIARKGPAIELSPEIRQALDVKEEKLSRDRLMQAILKAPVDLLWFGGIGTYVKASDEAETTIADSANRPLRVNGKQLRAKVIGEGANLALTEQGRIEAAHKGVCLNTDAVDNVGGVLCSDYEVNIKILLDGLVKQDALTGAQRTAWLQDLQGDVEKLILHHSDQTNQALSRMQQGFPLAKTLVDACALHPSGAQAVCKRIQERHQEKKALHTDSDGNPLTRPELAALMAYHKLRIKEVLVTSSWIQQDFCAPFLYAYFPAQLVAAFPEAIAQHPLRGQIVATVAANMLVGSLGTAFLEETTLLSQAPLDDVLQALMVAVMLVALYVKKIDDISSWISCAVMQKQDLWLLQRLSLLLIPHVQAKKAPNILLQSYGKDLQHVWAQAMQNQVAGCAFVPAVGDLAHNTGLALDDIASFYHEMTNILMMSQLRGAYGSHNTETLHMRAVYDVECHIENTFHTFLERLLRCYECKKAVSLLRQTIATHANTWEKYKDSLHQLYASSHGEKIFYLTITHRALLAICTLLS